MWFAWDYFIVYNSFQVKKKKKKRKSGPKIDNRDHFGYFELR